MAFSFYDYPDVIIMIHDRIKSQLQPYTTSIPFIKWATLPISVDMTSNNSLLGVTVDICFFYSHDCDVATNHIHVTAINFQRREVVSE